MSVLFDLNNAPEICDNDCGTVVSGGIEYYQNEAGEWIQGHNPNCGVFTSDSDSDMEIEPLTEDD